MKPRKLEHGFRRFGARIPYSLPEGHEDIDVPTFWLLLYIRTLQYPLRVPFCDLQYKGSTGVYCFCSGFCKGSATIPLRDSIRVPLRDLQGFYRSLG